MKLIRACWKSEQSGGGSCGVAKLCQPVVSIALRRVRRGRDLAGVRYVWRGIFDFTISVCFGATMYYSVITRFCAGGIAVVF